MYNDVLWIFLWGYIKSKVYVKNYKNNSDLKAAIISLLSDGIVTSTMENFGILLEMILRNKGGYFEK